MKIYIAGKITGDPDYKKKFAEAQKSILRKGHQVENPGLLSVKDDWDYEDYMRECYRMQKSCDATFFLPDWTDSKGAKREQLQAQSFNHETFYSLEDIPLNVGKKYILVKTSTLEKKILSHSEVCAFLHINSRAIRILIEDGEEYKGWTIDVLSE